MFISIDKQENQTNNKVTTNDKHDNENTIKQKHWEKTVQFVALGQWTANATIFDLQ